MKKICFKCQEVKELDDFYEHPYMADGHLNKCKKCTKKDNRENRKNNIDYYREYDKNRYFGERKSSVAKKANTWRKRFPEKANAHTAVRRAVKKGILNKKSCEVCGRSDTHAHHEDYNDRLNVRWLCPPCHSNRHKDINTYEEKG